MSDHDSPSRSPADRTLPSPHTAVPGRRSAALNDGHLSKLAIVYVRQSSTQQIFDHQESRDRQYALADYAGTLGWPRERIVVIDEDQGRSGRTVEQRPGFQRLLAEVTLDHVGLVLGLELSRLSRSSKDWYHLLELCAVFGTLLADQDGIYDANDSNDRLVLGLKGTMSEVELTTMRNRLERGKLHKAERGDLILTVPCGYLKLPHGEVVLDPDEQVRATVQLVFDKFAELGSFGKVYRYLRRHKIFMGCRVHQGPRRGELVWRPMSRALLGRMLHHPIYAGAYSYGRRRIDPKRTAANGGKVRMQYVPMSEWKVLKRDRFPAYITWERYLANQQQLLENRSWPDAPGVPRAGLALLPGLLVCGACGRRMHAGYRTKAKPYYECMRRKLEGSACCGLGAAAVDDLVSEQVVRALEPAALELSLQALQNIHQERERLHQHWQQLLERATQEAQRAERQYQAVEPENRLVARTLEQRWEEALRQERALQEEYDRFLQDQPRQLSADETARIVALARDIPTLWQSPQTTAADRKEIVRLLVARVVVHVRADSERTEVEIAWPGGFTTKHEIVRSVSRYECLSDYPRLLERIRQLRQDGLTIVQVATQLNKEGYRTPRSRKGYTSTSVRKLLSRKRQKAERPAKPARATRTSGIAKGSVR
jgi:DNA invertase Pin-like site-specific DNA recombinase